MRSCRRMSCSFRAQVLVTVPSRVLLEQFAEEMPGYCRVGTGYNDKIDFSCRGFISVTDSVQLLQNLTVEACFVDEGHHPLPQGMPSCKDLFKFSATHKEDVDFRYSLGEAIEQGVLSDYDLTVPVTTEGHPYVCLANLLLSQAGRFRRVLAYCNSIAEAKRFRQVLETTGLAAWHINGETSSKERERVMTEFSGELQKRVHVLVTVQVLGEGVNIPNADTCMFVEPRSSYVSIVQAIGRVLRPHLSKPMAHIVLPATALPATSNRAALAPPGLSHPAGGAQSIAKTAGSVEHVQSPESDSIQLDPGSVDAPRARAAVGAIARNGSKNFHGRQLTDQTSETSRFAGSDEVPSAALVASVANAALGSGSSRRRTNANNHCNNHHHHHETELVRCQSSLPQQDELDSLSASAALIPASTTALAPEATALTACKLARVGGAMTKPTKASWNAAAEGKFGGARRPSARIGRGAGPASAGLRAEGRRDPSGPRAMTHGEQGELPDRWQNDEEAGLQTHPARPASAPPATVSQPEALLVQLPAASAAAWEAAPGTKPAEVVPRRHGTGAEASMESEENLRSVTHRRACKLKLKRGDGAGWFGSGHTDRLDRFLEAIAQADSRFVNQDIRQLQSRLSVTDCRLQQPAMQQLLARDVLYQLASILQRRDAFDLRLQAVEKFDQDHGKLPRQQSKQLEERTLAVWLHNVGRTQKQQKLSAERVQKLLNSSCGRLRARAATWLEPDAYLKLWLEELRQFVRLHHRMPDNRKSRPRAEQRFAKSLSKVVNPTRKNYERRLQLAEKVGPIVADWVKSWRTRKLRVHKAQWNRQCDRLLRFVEVHGRLPQRSFEQGLYSWLLNQRRQLNHLPDQLQAKLRDGHPVIAAFLQS